MAGRGYINYAMITMLILYMVQFDSTNYNPFVSSSYSLDNVRFWTNSGMMVVFFFFPLMQAEEYGYPVSLTQTVTGLRCKNAVDRFLMLLIAAQTPHHLILFWCYSVLLWAIANWNLSVDWFANCKFTHDFGDCVVVLLIRNPYLIPP